MSRHDPAPLTCAMHALRTCEQAGAELVFGYPGGAALPLFDALHASSLRLILARHEQGAVHMADGYARLSGKPGVAVVTSGPGATNALTGIYTAAMDSAPVVVFCGQVAAGTSGTDAFQEVDVFSMSLPVVKHSYRVTDPALIRRVVREAFHVASFGRPGPVLIDMPKDVAAALVTNDEMLPDGDLWEPRPFHDEPDDREGVAALWNELRRARRPVLLAGHGVVLSRAAGLLLRLAERLRTPVITTLLGKGGFPERHPLALGMVGMHGTAAANRALAECDLVFAIGSRWDDRVVGNYRKFCPGARKLHIDIDPAEIGKVVLPDAYAIGDAGEVMRELLRLSRPLATEPWLAQCAAARGAPARHTGALRATEVLHAMDELTGGRAVFTTDVGQHQMWAAQCIRMARPYGWLSSGGAGTMGFGFPAALGAQLADPGATVVAIVGDGGFQMTMAELATAARLRLPVVILLLDNRHLGMVRQWQDMFYDGHRSGVAMDDNPDFVRVAEAYGIRALRLRDRATLGETLTTALTRRDGPCLVHAEVALEDDVFPMVPAGCTVAETLYQRPAVAAESRKDTCALPTT